MSNYQRSDQQVMLTDTFLAIKEMQESVQTLSAKISALSDDVDTLTRSLTQFSDQLTKQKTVYLETVGAQTAEIVETTLLSLNAYMRQLAENQQNLPVKRKKRWRQWWRCN